MTQSTTDMDNFMQQMKNANSTFVASDVMKIVDHCLRHQLIGGVKLTASQKMVARRIVKIVFRGTKFVSDKTISKCGMVENVLNSLRIHSVIDRASFYPIVASYIKNEMADKRSDVVKKTKQILIGKSLCVLQQCVSFEFNMVNKISKLFVLSCIFN
jgi:hypothetical protein